MIDFVVTGTVSKVILRNKYICIFSVSNEDGELLCSITNKNIDIAKDVKEGKLFRFMGYISGYRKGKGEASFLKNNAYIVELKEIACKR